MERLEETSSVQLLIREVLLAGGMIVILIFALIAIFLPFFIQSPTDFLGTPLSPPSLEYIFGTNGQGQDVFAQTVCGARQTRRKHDSATEFYPAQAG